MYGITRQTLTIVTVVSALLLGGCLMQEETAVAGAAGGDVPGQNNPPTISGSPQSAVMMGGSYSFTPTANDLDGDILTFSVQNLPTWATFSTSTGRVSGQPTLADVGVFQNLVISVSDGSNSASLPGYTITVSQVELGSITLSWTPPTENTDGTTLTDLDGYRIYYGVAQGNYPNQVVIDTAGISTYVIENLMPDTYYIVATSVNSMGVESGYSNVAIKTVEGS